MPQTSQYGPHWLLKNARSEQIYDTIGTEYCRSRGTADDETPLYKLELADGDRLLAIRGNQAASPS